VYQDPILGLEGLDAVVDKDRVSSILAGQLGAEVLMFLTNVDAVFEGWGTPGAKPIRAMSLVQADGMIGGGSLDAGGMKPKLEAAADFVRKGGARAIIARLSQGPAALRGETGTTIRRSL
jgi:carbamate kinase